MAVQERAERTRGKLVSAAATVFDRVGYQRATLMAISEEAKVTKGGLSFHFSTKAALARAVQVEGHAVSAAALEELARRPGPALDIVVDMTHTLAALMRDHVVVRAATRIADECDTPEDPAVHAQLYWLSVLYRTLSRADGDGSLTPGTDVRAATALVLSMAVGSRLLDRTPYQRALGPWRETPADTTRQWLADMWRIVRPALGGESAATDGPLVQG